jgi:KUP system potassium uptake protein
VVSEMKNNGEVNVNSRYESLSKNNMLGDFRFVVIEKFLSYDNVMPIYEKIVLSVYNIMKRAGLSDEKAFGLDTSNVLIEKVPIVIKPPKGIELKRV